MSRGWVMVNRCCLCKQAMESVRHLFPECTYTDQVRRQIQRCMPIIPYTDQFRRGQYKQIILYHTSMPLKRIQLVLVFLVWRERCLRTFTEKQNSVEVIAQEIRMEYRSWFQVQGAPE